MKMYTVTERLLRYVQIDTQSDPQSEAFPSTEKQHVLAQLLAAELKAMGIADAHADAYGYVYATIPANIEKQVPVICFCSHIDTAPDCSGTGVKPILHENYQGQDIILPDDPTQVLRMTEHPHLKTQIGKNIITASGTTLLGADDKAGVSIIMDLAHQLTTNPAIPHGIIKILFTPDEEVGRGTEKVDLKKMGADFAYTLDGGEPGTFEDETFSADGMTCTIHGVIAHPGAAKGKLVNALKIAAAFVDALPKETLAPEVTSGREGFVHPVRVHGLAETAQVEFIIRDFDTKALALHEAKVEAILQETVAKYPGATYSVQVVEQYRNMKEVLDQYPQVVDYAREAYTRCGLPFIKEPIRGGTDGSRLSFMGLPAPNIFTGMQSIHGKQEWVGVSDMEQAVDVLTELVQVWAERS
jgi:tripeptide aminopeptidase